MNKLKIYTWTWTERRSDIRIFEGNNVIGFIYSFFDNKVSKINTKNFFANNPPRQPKIFISDPIDNKVCCEIFTHEEYPKYRIESSNFKYVYNRTGNIFKGKKLSLSNDKKLMIELIIPKGIFPTEGTINVYDLENIELGLYCLFHIYSIQDPRDDNS